MDDLRQVHEQVHFLHVSRHEQRGPPEIHRFWFVGIFLKKRVNQSLLYIKIVQDDYNGTTTKNGFIMSTRNKFLHSICDSSIIIYTYLLFYKQSVFLASFRWFYLRIWIMIDRRHSNNNTRYEYVFHRKTVYLIDLKALSKH